MSNCILALDYRERYSTSELEFPRGVSCLLKDFRSIGLKIWTTWTWGPFMVFVFGQNWAGSHAHGLWETHKHVLPSGHGAGLQLSQRGMSDHPCLPKVPTHVCFLSNPSQYKWMFAGPWDHTDYLRQNNNCLVAAARLFHGRIGLAEKWINFKKEHSIR